MKKKLLESIILIFILGIYTVSAQQLKISLNDVFNLADSYSKGIIISKLDLDAAQEALRTAKLSAYPDISVSLSGSYLGNGYLWDRNFQNGQSVDIPHFGNNFTLMATQVIYAGGAIKSEINLAKLSTQMSNLNLKNNIQEIRFLLASNYLELFKLCNELKVVENNMELTRLLLEKMKARMEQGTVLKNDIIRYELLFERYKLQKANLLDTKNIINHQLVTTLHLPDNTEILPDSNILTSEISLLTEEDWQSNATQNNLTLQQAELGVKLSEQKEKLARSEMLPKIVAIAADNLDGPVTIEVPALNRNFNYWYVGVGIQYNLSSLYKSQHKVSQAHLKTRQVKEQYALRLEQIDNEIYASYINLKTSFMELKIQEKNMELANQNYALIEHRYQNDLALITDMLDAGNAKLTAELDLVNTKVNLIYNYLKLKYISGIL